VNGRARGAGGDSSGTLDLKRWEIRPRDGSLPIRGDLRVLAGTSPKTAVIVCHGFKGFREWGFFPSVARAIARRGYAAITFDLTHNGVGDDGVAFSGLDRFAQQTHSGNLAEIQRVIDATLAGSLHSPAPDRVALFGHSRGGAEALLAAARDTRVSALVTWAAIASFDRWSAAQVATWQAGGTVHIANARTGQEMPIGPGYWADILDHGPSLDLLGSAGKLTIPWLIVHGDADETVSIDDGRRLFEVAGENAELCVIEQGKHTFGATHPYSGPTPELQTAVQTSLGWLDEQLD